MKQLRKRTFILAGLQLQSGRQASRQQQASSPQAPLDRIRLLCSRLLLLLRENEKVAPAAWQGAHTHTHRGEMITDWQAHMHVWTGHTTHVHNCTNTCRLRADVHITSTDQPATATANICNQTFIWRIYHAIKFSVTVCSVWLHSKNWKRHYLNTKSAEENTLATTLLKTRAVDKS